MMLKSLMIVLALTLTTVQVVSANDERGKNIEHQIADLKDRLALSDAQTQQITPILEASANARKEILKKHGIDLENFDPESRKKLSFREKRKLGGELKASRKNTQGQLELILTDKQMNEYRKIQQERKDKLRDHMKNRGE